jgi:hypothetical protein
MAWGVFYDDTTSSFGLVADNQNNYKSANDDLGSSLEHHHEHLNKMISYLTI